MSSQYGELSPLVAEISLLVWRPQQISIGFAAWLCYCNDVAEEKPTKLCTMFGCTFLGALAP